MSRAFSLLIAERERERTKNSSTEQRHIYRERERETIVLKNPKTSLEDRSNVKIL